MSHFLLLRISLVLPRSERGTQTRVTIHVAFGILPAASSRAFSSFTVLLIVLYLSRWRMRLACWGILRVWYGHAP